MKSKALDIICLILKIIIPLILIANLAFCIAGDIKISLELATYEASDIMYGKTTIQDINSGITVFTISSFAIGFALSFLGWLLMIIFKTHEKRKKCLNYFLLMLIISFLNPLIIYLIRLLLLYIMI